MIGCDRGFWDRGLWGRAVWGQAAILALAAGSLSACGSKPQEAVKTQEFARTACVVNGTPTPIAVDLGATPTQEPAGARPVSATAGMDTAGTGTLARTDQGGVSAAVAAACKQINGTPAAAPVTVETVPSAPKPKPHPQGPTGSGGPSSIGEPVGAGAPSATP